MSKTAYVVRYVNCCQGDPIESRHRNPDRAIEMARRLNNRITGHNRLDMYRAEEVDDYDETVAYYDGEEWRDVADDYGYE